MIPVFQQKDPKELHEELKLPTGIAAVLWKRSGEQR